MGIDTNCAIVVGLSHEDLGLDDERIEDLIDDEDIEVFSPFYDADRDACIFGFPIQTVYEDNYSGMEVELDEVTILLIKEKFFRATGKKAKLLLTLDIC